MRTAIMTDTNSGITVAEGKQNGIYVLPMPVLVNGEDYLEGETIVNEQLYAMMQDGADVMTSQPAPGEMIDMWETILDDGYDDLIYIPMSSGLSSSCHAAIQFAQEYEGRVQVADNHRISVTLHESVYDAKRLADHGHNAAEIKEILEREAYNSSIYITVNSLVYLKKSGRVTAAGAAIAAAIHLKPVLTIQGEKLDAFAKARGMAAGERKMIEATQSDIQKRFAGIPKERIHIGAAGTFEHQKDTDEWVGRVRDAFPGYTVFYNPLSCSIACHVGVNAAGMGVCSVPEIHSS